jgi:hypothetical protein
VREMAAYSEERISSEKNLLIADLLIRSAKKKSDQTNEIFIKES